MACAGECVIHFQSTETSEKLLVLGESKATKLLEILPKWAVCDKNPENQVSKRALDLNITDESTYHKSCHLKLAESKLQRALTSKRKHTVSKIYISACSLLVVVHDSALWHIFMSLCRPHSLLCNLFIFTKITTMAFVLLVVLVVYINIIYYIFHSHSQLPQTSEATVCDSEGAKRSKLLRSQSKLKSRREILPAVCVICKSARKALNFRGKRSQEKLSEAQTTTTGSLFTTGQYL